MSAVYGLLTAFMALALPWIVSALANAGLL